MADGGVTKIISETAKGLEEAGGKITKAISTRLHGLGQATRKAADHFDKAEDDITDRVPVYTIDHDGNVSRVVNEGGVLKERPVADGDPGVGAILNEGEGGKATTWKKDTYQLSPKPPGLTKVSSEQIDPNASELSRATARARLARGNSGGGTNYAAFHYKNGDDEFILVGTSAPNQAHSERFAGIPFVSKGIAQHVDSVYTERSPCALRGRMCQEWLPKYFTDPNLRVTHSFEYGTKAEATASRRLLDGYLKGLFA